MIQLRREMEEAVDREDYERASEIRDELLRIEQLGNEPPAADSKTPRLANRLTATDGDSEE